MKPFQFLQFGGHRRVGLFAAIVSFCAYTCIFSFRKAFNVAAFAEQELFGMPFKVVLVMTQVAGYMCSKFYGIRFIAEMGRNRRGILIIGLVVVAQLSWLLFAMVPAPYNFWCLFLNGFPLGLLWGIVFSYVEGRRATDFIGATLAVSFIFGSGIAKSVAEAVMRLGQVSEYWMPFVVGLMFFLPLLLFIYLLERLPGPDPEDIRHRTLRTPMTREMRSELLRKFFPGILLLVLIYVLVTILREVRDSFMADMWRESGQPFNISSFAQTESIISLLILCMVALMALIKDNFKAFIVSKLILLTGFVIAGAATLYFRSDPSQVFLWMTLVGLGLYMSYIPFNSNLFDRFIASFRFSGNVGFLIYIADSFGYLGSIVVLLSKTVLKVQLDWTQFFVVLTLVVSVAGVLGTLLSLLYFVRKHRSFKVLNPATDVPA